MKASDKHFKHLLAICRYELQVYAQFHVKILLRKCQFFVHTVQLTCYSFWNTTAKLLNIKNSQYLLSTTADDCMKAFNHI